MKRTLGRFIIVFGFVSAILLSLAPPVSAAFNKDLLIDDPLFDSVGTMNAERINSFLNGYPNSCISPNSGFEARVPNGYSPSNNFSYGDFVSAGHVLATAAEVYGINPQVLLVTLEKEQSLVTGRNSSTYCNTSEHKYAAAMGYGCPDSGGSYSWSGVSLYRRSGVERTATGSTCVNAANKAGFSQQVIRAAWLFKFSQQRSMGNTGWAIVGGNWNNSDDLTFCYTGYMTQGTYKRCPNDQPTYYDGWATIDNTATHMNSGATAALYRYTPHFNGNQNFVAIFEGWFGSTLSCETPRSSASTLGVYNQGYFYQRNCHTPGWANNTVQFGNSDWIPLSGDWNRDGVFTPGAYDPNTGRFYLRNTNDGGAADLAFQYGNIGWLPLAGDWNGNGYWSIGLYDPATSTFYLKDFNGGGSADYVATFGNGGWKPIVGDWDNNSSMTIGVYNPATSIFYLNNQSDSSAADRTFPYGNVGWTPLAGDWDGNGYWSIALYDPASSTFYLRNMNDGGSADITTQYGNANWKPIVGDWDGRR